MAEYTVRASTTGREPLELTVPRAQETAAILAERVRYRDAQLRRSFVRRGKSTKPTPLMQMLRGGRGGEVRLKFYLSCLWIAVAPPHEVTYPARTWATLLGLPDPTVKGARRINDAAAWLEEAGYIRLQSGRGVPSTVRLLSETGNGRPYTLPGVKIQALAARKEPITRHIYDKVPHLLWTNGWMPALSGPALACLLVLLTLPRTAEGESAARGVWFTTSLLEDRYDMSDDTRQRGMRSLAQLGLIEKKSKVLARTSADFQRARSEYRLLLPRLAEPPLG
jgi:hypothetical protein